MNIINYPKLEEMFSGKTERVEKLISALRKRVPEWIAEAQDASASGEPKKIREVCHRISGAAGTITAEKLEAAAIEWGNIVKQDRTDEMTSGYENLIKSINELEEHLRD